MKNTTAVTRRILGTIECDRCKLLAQRGDLLFDSMISVEHRARFDRPFGAGSVVQLDFCEDCFNDVLSGWLRVLEPC